MLPQENRLRATEEFKAVYRRGHSKANPYLVLYRMPNGQSQSRFGFSVSKKIGKAHVRNLYKRRLREVARHHLPHFEAGYDMIVVARKPLANCDFWDVQRHFLTLAERSGLIHAQPHPTSGPE